MTAPVAAPGSRSARLRALATGPLLVIGIGVLVGFLIIGQLRGSERFRQRLEAESEVDLTRILAALTTEADALRDEIGNLKLQLLRLETSTARDDAALEAADAQLNALQVLAGTVPVTGPGVTVAIEDPEDAIGYDTLIDIVQELRDAGAEAIGVNGRRVGVASSFAARDGVLTLDGGPLRPPYRVTAIGQAATLEGGLKIPGGAVDSLESLRAVTVTVQRAAALEIPALAQPPSFRAARPVTSPE